LDAIPSTRSGAVTKVGMQTPRIATAMTAPSAAWFWRRAAITPRLTPATAAMAIADRPSFSETG